jgi:hypothetical protein
MPLISLAAGIVTQINTFTVPEGGQQALIDLLTDAAQFASETPGCGSRQVCIEATTAVGSATMRKAMALTTPTGEASTLAPIAGPLRGTSRTLERRDGTHLHVVDAGSGDRVVLLVHGFGVSSSSWSLVRDLLVEDGFRVLANGPSRARHADHGPRRNWGPRSWWVICAQSSPNSSCAAHPGRAAARPQ